METQYSVGEFASKVGVSPATVRNWCSSGKLKFTRTEGGHRRIAESELTRMQKNSDSPGEKTESREYSVGAFAEKVGVTPATIRNWCTDGKIQYSRTKGGHRRIPEAELERLGKERSQAKKSATKPSKKSSKPARTVAVYGRVAHQQKAPKTTLKQQVKDLKAYAKAEGWSVTGAYTDIGSSVDESRPGLHELLTDARAGAFDGVVVTDTNRLARYGYTYLEQLFAQNDVDVVTPGGHPTGGVDDEAVDDLVTLVNTYHGGSATA